jgi:hypothetical protein
MAKQPGGSKPKAKTTPKDERPQIERFKETARSLGVDETGQEFMKMLRSVLPEKRPKRG